MFSENFDLAAFGAVGEHVDDETQVLGDGPDSIDSGPSSSRPLLVGMECISRTL